MARAAVSLATTQPRSSRPSTSGRTPWGSRAAYRVSSSMKTKLNAPLSSGSTSSAVASRVRSGLPVSSAVTRAVSVVLPRLISLPACDPCRSSTRSRSSTEFVRLPLWARATVPPVPPSVGWAFSHRPAGRGVAGVTDGDVPAQGAQRALVEDLADQPHVLVDEDLLAVGRRNAGRLLPAVLQGVEAEVGELGDLLARGPDAEDTAGVLRCLVSEGGGVEIVRESSVSASHVSVSHRGKADRPGCGQRRRSASTARSAARKAPSAANSRPKKPSWAPPL